MKPPMKMAPPPEAEGEAPEGPGGGMEAVMPLLEKILSGQPLAQEELQMLADFFVEKAGGGAPEENEWAGPLEADEE